MATTEAYITPALLQWARGRYFPTVMSAAEKLHIPAEKLDAWERGDLRPTFRQAQSLASRLHIPFGYLFLTSPPKESLPLPDLRTVAGMPPGLPSPDFLDVLNDAQRKQSWYREELESENATKLEFVGRFASGSPAEEIAADLSITLGIDDAMRRSVDSWEAFLTQFIRNAESAGVLVLRSGVAEGNNNRKLSVEEFRGFVIADDVAPLVFINSQDAKSAQIFTLAHELAHIWINQSGVSNPDFRRSADGQVNDIERLCNRVAAETLLPEREFLLDWNDSDDVAANIRALTRRYRVSAITVLRQALDFKELDEETYWTLFQAERDKRDRKGTGGEFYNTFFARNSRTFCATLIAAAVAGRVSDLDTAKLLNVKGQTIRRIAEHLFGGKPQDA